MLRKSMSSEQLATPSYAWPALKDEIPGLMRLIYRLPDCGPIIVRIASVRSAGRASIGFGSVRVGSRGCRKLDQPGRDPPGRGMSRQALSEGGIWDLRARNRRTEQYGRRQLVMVRRRMRKREEWDTGLASDAHRASVLAYCGHRCSTRTTFAFQATRHMGRVVLAKNAQKFVVESPPRAYLLLTVSNTDPKVSLGMLVLVVSLVVSPIFHVAPIVSPLRTAAISRAGKGHRANRNSRGVAFFARIRAADCGRSRAIDVLHRGGERETCDPAEVQGGAGRAGRARARARAEAARGKR
ncbi:hypothetical protein PSPO01_14834 [Paraphaeosphaeria sporulosa]